VKKEGRVARGREEQAEVDNKAEIAWRKLSAVLPMLTKEGLLEIGDAAGMLKEVHKRMEGVEEFGSTETIETEDEEEFAGRVAKFVTEKEEEQKDGEDDEQGLRGDEDCEIKDTTDKTTDGRGGILWPLVKSFR